MKKRNKKAQGLPLQTIAIVILIILVVVFIALYFTGAIKIGKGTLSQFTGGEENLQDVVSGCIVACSSGGEVDFCDRKRSLRFNEGKDTITVEITCNDLKIGGTATAIVPKDKGTVTLPTVSIDCNLPCA